MLRLPKSSLPRKLFLLTLVIALIGLVLPYIGQWVIPLSKLLPTSLPGTAVSVPSKTAEAGLALSEKLAERLNTHNKLPERSPLGLSLLGDSQVSNNLKMNELLETLAIELGSSPSLALLRTIQENTQKEQILLEKTKSNLPEVAAQAKEGLNASLKESQLLKNELQKVLASEGFPLPPQAIEDLCKSPNGHDHASLLAAFHHIKSIAETTERRLLAFPCTEEAQKYYATQFILLACLDKIQTGLILKIQETHIPKSLSLQKEAAETREHALALLQAPTPTTEKQVLETNIATCEKTIELAQKTQKKLLANLAILENTREKTRRSLQTAQNSHRTVLLRNELAALNLQHTQDIESIQNLLVPEMVAVSFSNPENPEILPRLKQTSLTKP